MSVNYLYVTQIGFLMLQWRSDSKISAENDSSAQLKSATKETITNTNEDIFSKFNGSVNDDNELPHLQKINS